MTNVPFRFLQLLSTALDRVEANVCRLKLYPYQRQGVEWMLKREMEGNDIRGGILADDMGLGKTMQMLALVHANPQSPTLIVCPVSVVQHWVEKCVEHIGVEPLVLENRDMRIGEVTPTTLRSQAVVIAPHSCFNFWKNDYINHLLLQTRFGRVVVDEAQVCKNTSTDMFWYLAQVPTRYRWCISATPVVCKGHDVRSLVQFLLGSIERDAKATAKEIVEDQEALKELFIRRTKNCVLEEINPPPLELRVHTLTFSEKERVKYGRRFMSARSLWGDVESAGEKVNYCDMLMLIQKLRRDCVCETKVDALVDCFQGHARGVKSLVFCNWIFEIDLVCKALGPHVDEVMRFHGTMTARQRSEVTEAFQTSSSRKSMVIVMQIQAGSVGLNLQEASRVYMMTPHWNATSEMQAMSRAHRVNTVHTVEVTRLVVLNTIEEYMHHKQQSKLEIAAELLDDERLETALETVDNTDLTWDDVNKFFKAEKFDEQYADVWALDEDDEGPAPEDDEDLPRTGKFTINSAGDVVNALAEMHRARTLAIDGQFVVQVVLTRQGGEALRERLNLRVYKAWSKGWSEDVYKATAEAFVEAELSGARARAEYCTLEDASEAGNLKILVDL